MRRSLSIAVVVALVLAAGATAATIRGTVRGELLRGTTAADRIDARGGNDRVEVVDGGRDTVACGPGRDIVTSDPADRVGRDCEVVSRRIAYDPLTSADTGQHRSQLESHAAASGETVVSVFQNARFVDGGAGAIGFSTSVDGGRTWRAGLLPGLTRSSPAPGEARRASDPVVAHDDLHGVWLANTLIFDGSFSALFVSRSTDGLTWSEPVAAARTPGGFAYDKNWIACDNGAASPYRGSCYVVYTDVVSPRIAMLVSRDGGSTWSAPITVDNSFAAEYDPQSNRLIGVGAIPLVQPDGALTVVYVGRPEVVQAARSINGGASFSPAVDLGPLNALNIRFLRAPPLPAATVDASGRLYVLTMDCSLRRTCDGNDLVLSTSTDGRTWSRLPRLPRTGFDSFVPGIAAHPTIAGRLAVVTYVRTSNAYSRSTCRIGVAVTRSTNGGASWTAPQRLDAEPMLWSWLANSNLGAFLGDYVGIAYTSGGVVPTFPLATRPSGGRLNEAMFATVLAG